MLEAGSVGNGASGRSAGLVLYGAARGGLERTGGCMPSLERVVREARIECRLHLKGCWEIVRRGNDVERHLPWHLNGDDLNVARTTPGGTVNPMALLDGLIAAASRAGAVIHENARVDRILFGEQPALECGRVTIQPRFVVTSMGAWTPTLVSPLPPLDIGVILAVATMTLSPRTIQDLGLWGAPPFVSADVPTFWGRPLGDGRTIFGGEFVRDEGDDAAIDAAIEDSFARLENRVRGLNPKLKAVRFTARWTIPAAFPRDLRPMIGPMPGVPRVLTAFGYSNHGVALPVWAGEQIAAAIADERPLPRWASLSRR